MAINFPENPTTGQTFSVGNSTYTWNGTSWETEAKESYHAHWEILEPEFMYDNATLGHWNVPWPDLSTFRDTNPSGSILHGYRVNPGDELRVDTHIQSYIAHVFYYNENDTTNGDLGDWSKSMTQPYDLIDLGTRGWLSFNIHDRDIAIPQADVTHVFVLSRIKPPVLKRKSIGTLYDKIIDESKSASSRKLYGKKILWLGTSIPRGGGWAEMACDNLGATCINRAIGSSTIRDRRFDGTLATVWQNFTLSLIQTISEKEAIIAEHNTGVTDGPLLGHIIQNRPTAVPLNPVDADRIIASSYENSIIPYIDGTDPTQVDVIVIEHGFNDFWLDNDETPAFRDHFKTVNSTTVLDRNTFPGGVKFIIDEIRKIKPQVQILLVTNYCADDINSKAIVDGVKNIGDYFALPVCDVSNIAGITNQITVPNTAELWNTWPWNNYPNPGRDMNVREYRIPDKIHPHTDATMITQRIMAAHLTEFLSRTITI